MEQLRGVSKRKGSKSRRWVLKAVYARRIAELDEARASGDQHRYGAAVWAYMEARQAWRAIRGWQ